MTALSFGTGALDAATYLGMDQVFGANMTGNVILVGLSAAGSPTVPLLGPLSALGGFVLGSWILGVILRAFTATGPKSVAAILWSGAVGMAGVCVAVAMLPMTDLVLHAVTFSIGVLMGFQAIAARMVGVPDISTVVITSTLSLLFSQAGPLRGRATAAATGRRVAAVLSMFLGAVVGALLLNLDLVAALILPAAILLAVAIIFTARAVAAKKAEELELELATA
ncbi:YoaK family protein [Kocuria sp. U4B]